MKRWFSFRSFLVIAGALVFGACSSSDDGSKKDVADTTQDTAPSDIDATTNPETVGDQVQTDLPADLPGADVADVAGDTEPLDLEQPDMWDSLPRLPQDKTFTTKYAAGVGRTVINPDRSISMGGFGACPGKYEACRMSTGVHDDIYATAVAIADTSSGEVVIFVGVDTVGMFLYDIRIIHEQIQKALHEKGIKFEGSRLVAAFSHSHAGPDTCGIWGAMDKELRDEEDYIIFVRERVVEAALAAYEDLQDVEMSWGQGTAPNVQDDKDSDDEDLFVIQGVKPGTEETVFTLTRWSGHPTAYGSDNHAISSDYLGTFRLKMEQELGGTAVFLNGPIGSVYTSKPEGCEMPDAFPDGFQDPEIEDNPGMDSKAACVGFNLADVAIAALANGTTLSDAGIKARHAIFKFHPTNAILMAFGKLGPIPLPDINLKDPEDKMDSEFSWITLGELNFLTTPGESFPSFSESAKTLLLENGITNPVTLGVAQDWMGYLMTKEQFNNGDPDLDYHRGLSPGDEVHPTYMARLQEVIEEEKGQQ